MFRKKWSQDALKHVAFKAKSLMANSPKYTLALCLVISSGASFASNEDSLEQPNKSTSPLEKLKLVLSEVTTNQPIAGELQVSFKDIEEFDGEPRESVGSVGFFIQEDQKGLTISYDKQVTEAIKVETAARVVDEEVETPTIDAIREVGTTRINSILSPISSINTYLSPATLTRVESIENEQQALTKMYFSMPVESFIRDKQVRKYVDNFEGELVITTNEQGVPVEMTTTFEGSGRAYIFFKMKAAGGSINRYELVDGRLVMTFSERFNSFDSTFGKGENSSVFLFSPLKTKPNDSDYLAKTSNDTSM